MITPAPSQPGLGENKKSVKTDLKVGYSQQTTQGSGMEPHLWADMLCTDENVLSQIQTRLNPIFLPSSVDLVSPQNLQDGFISQVTSNSDNNH